MARQPKPQPGRRCDWMTDEQLRRWIEACSGYLAKALEEERVREAGRLLSGGRSVTELIREDRDSTLR